MKKILLSILLCVCACCALQAQYKVAIHINGLADMPSVASKLETNLSKFFTELTNANINNRIPNMSGISINESARVMVKDIWTKSSPFYLPGRESKLYAVRIIDKKQLRIMPVVLSFNRSNKSEEYAIIVDYEGRILDFLKSPFPLAIQGNEISSGPEFDNIINYLERLATAHSKKDINFLKWIYSDDVMVISGVSIKNTNHSFRLDDRQVYTIQNDFKITIKDKTRYINDLIKVFNNNSWVKVEYRDVQIKKHPNDKYAGIYYVYLYQIYKSSTYSDEGYLTLVWDFRHKEEPKILLRAWFDKPFDFSLISLTLPTY